MRPRADGKNNRLLSAHARLLIRTTTVEFLMPGLENVTFHVQDLEGWWILESTVCGATDSVWIHEVSMDVGAAHKGLTRAVT